MKIVVYLHMTTPDLMKVSTFRLNLFFVFKVGSGSNKRLGRGYGLVLGDKSTKYIRVLYTEGT